MADDPNDRRANGGGPSGLTMLGMHLGFALIITTLFHWLIGRSRRRLLLKGTRRLPDHGEIVEGAVPRALERGRRVNFVAAAGSIGR